MMKFLQHIAPWVLILTGLAFAGLGLNMLLSIHSFQKKSIRSTGKVVKVNVGVTKFHSKYYSPVIAFQTEEGRDITFQSAMGYSEETKYPVGAHVKVAYLPTNPHKAYISDFKAMWSTPLMMLGFGIVCLTLGILKFSGKI